MKGKILLVDSDLLACRAYQKLFAKVGIEAKCAFDDEEAIQKFDGKRDLCIVIDPFNLPKRDPWEVIAKLKNNPTVGKKPVIVATTLDGDHWRQKAQETGADGFVNKFAPDQILEVIEKILGGGHRGNLR